MSERIRIFHFSDALCIWAYIHQIRVDELRDCFPDEIELSFHFIPVFGNARGKLEARFKDEGGIAAYGDRVQKIVAGFEHVNVHPEIWKRNVPSSSTATHAFLAAVRVLESRGMAACPPDAPAGRTALDHACHAVREAFFVDLKDVSQRSNQLAIAEQLCFPVSEIESCMDSGEAYAALADDAQLAQQYSISVSPVMVFNEGRQTLTGNVGYRVIEANVRELLRTPAGQHSWC